MMEDLEGLETLMYEAWQRGDIETQFDIISSRSSSNSASQLTVKTAYGVISVAAKRNHADIIRFLAKRVAQVTTVDYLESVVYPSALDEACRRGHLQSIETLVELGARPANEMLHTALCNGYLDVARFLDSKGVRVDDTQAEATLGAVCSKGNLDAVRYIVHDLCVEPTMLNFLAACVSQQSKVVLYLMIKGCGATAEVLGKNDVVVEAVGEALVERVKVVDETAIAVWRKLNLLWVNFNWFFHSSVGAQYVEIDLSNNKLHEIPVELLRGDLPFLMTLRLNHNKFKHLPPLLHEAATETNDRDSDNVFVESSCNSLNSFGTGVSLSRNRLTDLDISYNDLRNVPRYLFELPSLVILNLSHNWLTTLNQTESTIQESSLFSSSSNSASGDNREVTSISESSVPMQQFANETCPRVISPCFESQGSTASSGLGASVSQFAVEWQCIRLEKLDVSHNALTSLPDDVAQLRHLRKLRVHHNHLKRLPSVWHRNCCSYLEELDAKCNFLESTASLLSDIDPSWKTSLKYIDLSNNRLTEFPCEVCQLEALRCCLIYGNWLTEIPKSLKWMTKCLERLDLSHNLLGTVPFLNTDESMAVTSDTVAERSGRPRSQHVYASDVEAYVLSPRHSQRRRSNSESSALSLGQSQISESSVSTHVTATLPRHIKFHELQVAIEKRSPKSDRKLKDSSPFFKAENDPLVTALDEYFHLPEDLCQLKHVDISFNQFEDIPLCLCNISSLAQLIIVGNVGIHRLPLELSRCSLLWQLDVRGLDISFPQQLQTRVSKNTYLPVKQTLAYMSKLLRFEGPDYFIKLVIVGDKMSGKSSLCKALCNHHSLANQGAYNPSPPGVTFKEITVYPKGAIRPTSSTANMGLDCCVWEVTDPRVYNCLARTFFTKRTIHLLVWDTTQGNQGVLSVREWLQRIPRGDDACPVLVVGTHDEHGQQNANTITDDLQTGQYRTVNETVFVSSRNSWRSIESLRCLIYTHGRAYCQSLSKVPKSYSDMRRQFRDRCVKKVGRDGHLPLFTSRQNISSIISGIESHLKWDREFAPATRYLQEVGQLVYFDDPFEKLGLFYYTDLLAVFSKIAILVTLRITIETGAIEHEQAVKMLCDDRLGRDMLPTFLRLLERMGIAFPISTHSVLVPTLLPSNRPRLTANLSKHHTGSHNSRLRSTSQGKDRYQLNPRGTVQRVYSLHSMPTNFIPQLVARIKSSFDRWYSSHQGGHRKRTGSVVELPYLSASHDRRYSPRRTEVARMVDFECWKYGIVGFYEGGHLLVESIDGLRGEQTRVSLCGIQITVAGDTSVLGFVVDQVETLLTDWFPEVALAGPGSFYHLERIVLNRTLAPEIVVLPTTADHQATPRSLPLAGSEDAQQLGLYVVEQCCVHWQSHDTIRCPKSNQLIKLTDVIPDVLLQDVPDEMHISADELSFCPTVESFIGFGGEADVYVHTFRDTPVAVKIYNMSVGVMSPGPSVDGSFTAASQLASMLLSSVQSVRQLEAGFLQTSFSLPETAVRRSKAAMQVVDHLGDELCSLAIASRGLSMLEAFNKLRKEATFLLQLRHPCVVPLVGFCLRPLCLLTEYAPLGSLSSALTKVREAEVNDKSLSVLEKRSARPLFRDGVLGRALTWKIAFQVAKALEHLHDSRVVYHDLKSANVLLYSVDINTPINVKVADYGISQSLSLSGVKETTALGSPGFQAPELTAFGVRERIFDEQTDIFSFAMVLYELLTGYRPFAQSPYTALEIPDKISLGERPPLALGHTFTRIVDLMEQSWRQESRDRPTARQLVTIMLEESFAVQHSTLSIPRCVSADHVCAAVDYAQVTPVNCLTGSREEGIAALFQASPSLPNESDRKQPIDMKQSGVLWAIGGVGSNRRLSVVNAQTGHAQLKEISFPGSEVMCMASVDDRQMWLGVEQAGSIPEVHVYSTHGADSSFMWEFQWKSRLDETPLAILSQKCPNVQEWDYCVLLGLRGGLMTAFYGKERPREDLQEELVSSRSSLADWTRTRRKKTANYRDAIRREGEQAPAYLPLIRDPHFSWDRNSFRAVDQTERPVTCMTAVGTDEVWCGAGPRVCVLSRRDSPQSYLSRSSVIRLRGFNATHIACVGISVWIADSDKSLLWRYDADTKDITTSLDLGKVSPSDPFPCNVPSCFYSAGTDAVTTGVTKNILEEAESRQASTQLESATPSRSLSHTESPLRDDEMDVMGNVGAIAAVGDALWVGRRSGDILIIDGNRGSNELQVAIGCLQPLRTSPRFGCPVRTLTPLSCGLVVVARLSRLEELYSEDSLPTRLHSNYFSRDRSRRDYNDDVEPLDVWEAWSSPELTWFRTQQSHLD